MGKAHKRWKNRQVKAGNLEKVKRQKGREFPVGACFEDKCHEVGGESFVCRTCEELVAAGKRKPEHVFRVQTCPKHREKAEAKVRAHAILAHPYNMLRVVGAGLKGEL
jgi:hypothetical protein